MSKGLLVLYDDVSMKDSPEKEQLIYEFTKFASRNDDLKAATFVPVSKFLDDPDAYRHHLKASGLAFRLYGEVPRRMFRDELKLRDTFWKELLEPLNRSEDFYTGLRLNRRDTDASILVVHKALSEWAKLSNVPIPRETNPQYPDEPSALIVHLCTIVNIDGFTKPPYYIPHLTDVERARALVRENEDDDNVTRLTSELQYVRLKPMSFFIAAPNNKAEQGVYRSIELRNNQAARTLVTDYEDKWDFEDRRRKQTVNSSAEALRQMISVGLVETDPYREGLRQVAAPRQDDSTPWNKFIGRDQYDPRLFLEIWKFMYSAPPAPSADAAASAPVDADAPESPRSDE